MGVGWGWGCRHSLEHSIVYMHELSQETPQVRARMSDPNKTVVCTQAVNFKFTLIRICFVFCRIVNINGTAGTVYVNKQYKTNHLITFFT